MVEDKGTDRMMRAVVTAGACVAVILSGAAAFGADGFGRSATGGEGGEVILAASAEAFKEAVETEETAYVVVVSGRIDLGGVGGKVRIQSNKTIRGADANATIVGQMGFKKGSSNVIFEGLNITNPDDYELVREDGQMIIENVRKQVLEGVNRLSVRIGDRIIEADLTVSDRQRQILAAGGLLNLIREQG